jgi:ribonuclease P protein component
MAGEKPAVRVFVRRRTRSQNKGRHGTHEEDVSAQEARPEARARLPRPHGFEGRTSRADPPTGEGTQAADGLSAPAAMPSVPMLRRRADFEALGRLGRARTTDLLVLRSLRTDRRESRVGLSTPRSLGGAVERNRVKRRLREAMRRRMDRIGPGWDLLVIARPAAATASMADLGDALDALLRQSEIGRE